MHDYVTKVSTSFCRHTLRCCLSRDGFCDMQASSHICVYIITFHAFTVLHNVAVIQHIPENSHPFLSSLWLLMHCVVLSANCTARELDFLHQVQWSVYENVWENSEKYLISAILCFILQLFNPVETYVIRPSQIPSFHFNQSEKSTQYWCEDLN